MPQPRIWPLAYITIGSGLVIGIILYLMLYNSDMLLVQNPNGGLPLVVGLGSLIGLGYYVLFKLTLRRFIEFFLKETQGLVTRPIALPARFMATNELDKLAELLSEAFATLKRLDRFSVIAKEIVASLDSPRVTKRILSTAVESLPADGGLLFLLDRETGHYKVSTSYPLLYQQLERKTFTLKDIALDGTKTSQVPPCVIAPTQENRSLHPIFQEMKLQSLLIAPMAIEHQVIGFLTLFNQTRLHAFDEHDLRLACIFADLAAVAIDNARRYKAIQEEQKKLETILCDSSDGVVVLDRTSRILMLNPAAEYFLQVRAEQAQDQTVSVLGMADLISAFEAAEVSLASVLREITVPEGRMLYASITPVYDIGWVVVMQDVTLLRKLDQFRAEWVATISHDMKSPITVMQMAIGLLAKTGQLNEAQERLVQRAKNSMVQLQTLVNNILDLARLENGPGLSTRSVQLAEVIAQAVNQVEPLATNKQQRLITEVPPDLPPACG